MRKRPGRMREATAAALDGYASRVEVLPPLLAFAAGAVTWAVVYSLATVDMQTRANIARRIASRLRGGA